jgi:hypothetical protein
MILFILYVVASRATPPGADCKGFDRNWTALLSGCPPHQPYSALLLLQQT